MVAAKWVMLADDIRDKIKAGEYRPGDRLPSTSQLCAQYGISAIVVRNAMLTLKAEGLVKGVPGVATFIAEDLPKSARP
jgi:GntR family transcriptional regulator